jgi:hypothetical protein
MSTTIWKTTSNGYKDGNVFILLTRNTQEQVWFDKMMENVIDNFNIIVKTFRMLIKYKENE